MPFSDHPRTSPIVWATPLVGIILFILSMGAFFYTLHSEDQSQAKLRTIRDVEQARRSIRSTLLEAQDKLNQLARNLEQSGLSEDLFRKQAAAVLNDTPELSTILLVNVEREAKYVVLPRGRITEVVHDPGSLVEDAESYWAYTAARETDLPVFSRPFLSFSGSVYTELHVPVLLDGQFSGTIAATIPISGLLSSAVPNSFTSLYLVSIVDGGGNMIASNSSRSFENATLSHETPLDPPGHGLRLRAVLYRTTTQLFQNILSWAVMGLSAVIVWSFILLYRHSKMRNEAERKLLAETKFRRAMENSVITGMRALDMTGRITYVNPAFCKMTGYREHELVGLAPPFPYWPEDSHQEQSDALKLVLSGRAPRQGLETTMKRRDGTVFAARLYVSPLIDGEGNQSGWMTSVTDITEPRRVREELAAAHRRFVRILEELDAAVVVEDPSHLGHEPIFVNRLHRTWFSAQQPPGMGTVLSDDSDEIGFEWLNTSNQRWYELRRRPISWVDGRIVVMQVATDITGRKEVEKVTRQQQEKLQFTSRLVTLGELASSLAHELNQPLTAISNYTNGGVGRLKSGAMTGQDLLPMLEKVSQQAQRAGDVIRRIREFVKQQEPKRTPTELDKIIQDAIGFSKLEARNQATQLEVYNPDPKLKVYADSILIEQVLMNLIKNAIEAMSECGALKRLVEIHVDLLSAQQVMIRVRDYGSGVPEEIRERLFESFFTTKSNGMGMGLNICRTIVEYHQGQLWVDPANGGGSEFKFTLPIVETHSEPLGIEERLQEGDK